MRATLAELLQGASREWKSDISRVSTSRDNRHNKPLDQTNFHVYCIMLAHNPGGKERTEKEFEALANKSGFKGIKVVCNAFGVYIIELLKKID